MVRSHTSTATGTTTVSNNLVWLCFRHHDAYDRRSSQAKGLQAGEVRHYRDALYKHLIAGPTSPAPSSRQRELDMRYSKAGRDIVNGTVINIAKAGRPAPPVIPGTVSEQVEKHNYLNYLIDRYLKFKKWECDQMGEKLKGALIHNGYRREFGSPVCHTPLVRYGDAVTYLQQRIRRTRLGRMEGANGNALYLTEHEYVVWLRTGKKPDESAGHEQDQ